MSKLYTYLFGIILTVSITTACSPSYEEQEINNLYAIQLPSSMIKTSSLNEEASLQYEDKKKDLYIIVIEEDKNNFHSAPPELKRYFALAIENYFTMDSLIVTEPVPFEVNGLNAMKASLDGLHAGNAIHLHFAAYESKGHFYHLAIWTTRKKKDKNSPIMKTILESFKELPQDAIL